MSESREDRIERYATSFSAAELARSLVANEDAADARYDRIATLEAALRPFAESYDPNARYESAHDVGGSLCLADFEAAHRALAQPVGEGL